MKHYFRYSSSAYYSAIAALPLLVAYEILLAFTRTAQGNIRNAAEVWMRDFMLVFMDSPRNLSFVMIAAVLVAIPVFKSQSPHIPLKPSYFGIIFLESIVYSLFVGLILHTFLQRVLLQQIGSLSGGQLQNLALSLGAGLFEELFFRVLLLNALFWGLSKVLPNTLISGFISIVAAAFLFSMSHYIGSLGEPFYVYSFVFRWSAGLLFTALYFVRGFAVVAYTHAFYDIYVLV